MKTIYTVFYRKEGDDAPFRSESFGYKPDAERFISDKDFPNYEDIVEMQIWEAGEYTIGKAALRDIKSDFSERELEALLSELDREVAINKMVIPTPENFHCMPDSALGGRKPVNMSTEEIMQKIGEYGQQLHDTLKLVQEKLNP